MSSFVRLLNLKKLYPSRVVKKYVSGVQKIADHLYNISSYHPFEAVSINLYDISWLFNPIYYNHDVAGIYDLIKLCISHRQRSLFPIHPNDNIHRANEKFSSTYPRWKARSRRASSGDKFF